MLNERTYRCAFGVFSLRDLEGGGLEITYVLLAESRRDQDSGEVLRRFQAFPSVIAYADDDQGANAKLDRMFDDYIDAHLEINGVEGFETHLLELGFEKVEPDGGSGWQWMPPGAVIESSKISSRR